LIRRYRDKERSRTPTDGNVVTTGPTFKSDDKKSISVKAPAVKPVATIPAPKIVKKIDMGAASNYGKSSLGINSPTHRNTHNEDLFGSINVEVSSKNVIEDIFNEANDFNPRADEILTTKQALLTLAILRQHSEMI
jgi:hypothetical protein